MRVSRPSASEGGPKPIDCSLIHLRFPEGRFGTASACGRICVLEEGANSPAVVKPDQTYNALRRKTAMDSIRIFVASPSDVEVERTSLTRIVEDINLTARS